MRKDFSVGTVLGGCLFLICMVLGKSPQQFTGCKSETLQQKFK